MYVHQVSFFSLPDFLRIDRGSRLVMVLEALDAERLLRVLEQERKGRRNDYPVRSLWYSLIAGLVYGRPTITSLIEELKINPGLRLLCGMTSEGKVPPPWVYSRFLKKLAQHQDLLQEIFDRAVSELAELTPDFGRNLAIDSTDVKAWSNPYRKPPSDPDAGWGVKKADGKQDLYRWLGYKLHLVVDADYEIPVAFEVTPANQDDGRTALPLLHGLKEEHPVIIERAEHFMADKGYDQKDIYKLLISERFDIKPVIPLNLRGEKSPPGITNSQGTPLCVSGQQMYYAGYDNGFLKYRCPAISTGVKCQARQPCCRLDGYGTVVKLNTREDPRRYTPVPRETKKWARLYKKRTAVERVNSRLKQHLLLDELRVRGLGRVKVRLTLSLLVMMGAALSMARRKQWEDIRRLVRAAAA